MVQIPESEYTAFIAEITAVVKKYVQPATPTTPPVDPPSTTLPVKLVSVTEQAAVISWSGTSAAVTIGRDGTDRVGTGSWSGPGTGSTATFDKLKASTSYTFTVTDSAGKKGSVAATTLADPVTPTSPTTPTTPTPTGKVSWSSGVWAQHDAAKALAFQSMRGGQALGNITVFTSRSNWGEQLGPWWKTALPTGFKGDLIIKIPVWTEDGDKGSDQNWKDLAGQIKSVDEDAWVALGWEMNLPGWNHAIRSSNFEAWIAQFRRAVNLMRSVAPKLRFTWNPNAGGDQSGASQRAAFQRLKDLCENYSLDSYDSWPAVVNESAWTYHLTTTNFIGESYTYAVANGKTFGLSEWGVARGSQWAGNQGGDNPFYIKKFMEFLKAKNAERPGSIAFDSYFLETDSYLMSGFDQNPKAGAEYAAQFK